jgi:hypothetical protein
MGSIWQEIQKPAWWFTAVVAGLLINLLAAYAKSWTDRIAARFSERRRLRLTDAEERRKQRIVRLTRDVELRHFTAYSELRCLILSSYFLLFSILSLVLTTGIDSDPVPAPRAAIIAGKVVPFFLCGLTLLMSTRFLATAVTIRGELRDARLIRGALEKTSLLVNKEEPN